MGEMLAGHTGTRHRRRGLLVGLAVVGAMLVPAALALACNPQAYLTLSKSAFTPGDTVGVSGSFFKSNVTLTVSLDRTGQSQSVTTTGSGSFQTSFALPADAPVGGYSVIAVGYEPNGDVTPGLPAKASFTVQPASAQTDQPAPVQDSQPAPSDAGSTAPSSSAPSGSSPQSTRPFREPSLQREPGVVRSRERQRTARGEGVARSPRPVQTVSVGGRPVFAGSVAPTQATGGSAPSAPATGAAPEQRPEKAAGRRPVSSDRSTGPQGASEATVADDVWSATGAEGSLSLAPDAGAAPARPGRGPGLGLGLVLLVIGATALVGGLAMGGARRRRVR